MCYRSFHDEVYEAIKIILLIGLELIMPKKWSWVGFRRPYSDFSKEINWIGRSVIILIVLPLVVILSEVSAHSQELDTFSNFWLIAFQTNLMYK